ncbi:MAG TPA: hypothetical protein VND93_16045 [Myxococcales bacterium]|nr:hypothetical protein [Myxococcales bacterium]
MRASLAAAAVVVLLGVAAACSASSSACFRTCPPLQGAWQVTFEPATDPADCQKINATLPDGELDITQQSSQLTATFQGHALAGTAFDTGDFALDGQDVPDGGGLDAFSFRGFYAGPAAAAADAGQSDGGRLSGTYDATLQRPGAQGTVTCRQVRSYAATRR